ncbi:hypothetical protein [Nitratifractor sp.]
MIDDGLLTAREVIGKLAQGGYRISKTHFSRLADEGAFPFYRRPGGKRRLYKIEEVKKALAVAVDDPEVERLKRRARERQNIADYTARIASWSQPLRKIQEKEIEAVLERMGFEPEEIPDAREAINLTTEVNFVLLELLRRIEEIPRILDRDDFEHRVVSLLASSFYAEGVIEADTGLETPALILKELKKR